MSIILKQASLGSQIVEQPDKDVSLMPRLSQFKLLLVKVVGEFVEMFLMNSMSNSFEFVNAKNFQSCASIFVYLIINCCRYRKEFFMEYLSNDSMCFFLKKQLIGCR